MKRLGNIYSKICEYNNLYNAYLEARKCKRYRTEILNYTFNLENNLIKLQNELLTGAYRQGRYREFQVFVPKERLIKALPFNDRVVQHAIYYYLYPFYDKKFYTHSYACRKGKGGHKASSQLKSWLYQAEKQNMKLYCLKCDVKKFFNSVDISILYALICNKIKDKKLLWLIRQILKIKPNLVGLPIGNLTSQLFANIYLNELDYFILEKLKPHHYIRYMDDFILLDQNKEKLKVQFSQIKKFLVENLGLEINTRVTRLFPVSIGIEFVGYIHYWNYVKVRKSTWKREKKNLKITAQKYKNNKITKEKLINVFASIKGHLQHADAYKTRLLINEYETNLLK